MDDASDADQALFVGFTARLIALGSDVELMVRTGGQGPPLVLLHGHPQTHAMWHRVAPQLARRHSLVMIDLRGYGDSSRPIGNADHAAYSRRTMAQDVIGVMDRLGHTRFAVLAHDRGARVAHRLGLDHPSRVTRMVLLDIAPTLSMYRQTSEAFARAYWHWFFLIQPKPLPERLIESDPAAYVRDLMGRRRGGLSLFDTRALAEYIRCMMRPGSAHGVCEDYRASASIDLVHDQASLDAGQALEMPLRVIWGEHGVIQQCFNPLESWAPFARTLSGGALPCGHYIAEEDPEGLLQQVSPFLEADLNPQ